MGEEDGSGVHNGSLGASGGSHGSRNTRVLGGSSGPRMSRGGGCNR